MCINTLGGVRLSGDQLQPGLRGSQDFERGLGRLRELLRSVTHQPEPMVSATSWRGAELSAAPNAA